MSDFYLSPLGAEYFEESDYILQNAAERYSISEAGSAGSGKDLLFSHLIELQDRPHYANIAYTSKTILAPMNLFTVGAITYEDILRGRVAPITNHILDGADAYISDAGVSLSNAIDSTLKKDYPGLHIYAALRRHLNDIQIHINAQTFERCYIIYREQCNFFIYALQTRDLGTHLLVSSVIYDRDRTAYSYEMPERANITDGLVEYRNFLIDKTCIHYDTTAFKQKIYKNDGAPSANTRLLKELLKYV